MWRKKGDARGWGFTLVGENDFDLSNFHPEAPTATFKPFYGVDNTGTCQKPKLPSSHNCLLPGNIYNTANIRSFSDLIARETNNIGLDLVMADGVSVH